MVASGGFASGSDGVEEVASDMAVVTVTVAVVIAAPAIAAAGQLRTRSIRLSSVVIDLIHSLSPLNGQTTTNASSDGSS